MENKKCNKCKEVKPKSEFRKASQRKDGVTPLCTECLKAIDKTWYNQNKQKKYEQVKERVSMLVERLREWKHSKGCYFCDEDEAVCLDLHHTDPSSKDSNIADMVTTGAGWESVMEEAKKCIVVCSNCHRKVHNNIIEL